jgi:CMP-N-acetylneuraminic acid synthetase
MKVLGVILARGGSKTIPLKNIALCGGRPLIYWTIKAALDSGVIDHLVVSTDHHAIAATVLNPEVFVAWRPEELAGDEVPSVDALIHTVEEQENWDRRKWPIIAELPVTNPLKTGEDVRGAIEIILRPGNADIDSVASVSQVVNHPSRVKKIGYWGEPIVVPYCDECGEHDNRKQDLMPAYERNGAIYVMRRETLLLKKDRFGEICVPYIMVQERGINIDTPFDLELCDLLLRKRAQEEQ